MLLFHILSFCRSTNCKIKARLYRDYVFDNAGTSIRQDFEGLGDQYFTCLYNLQSGCTLNVTNSIVKLFALLPSGNPHFLEQCLAELKSEMQILVEPPEVYHALESDPLKSCSSNPEQKRLTKRHLIRTNLSALILYALDGEVGDLLSIHNKVLLNIIVIAVNNCFNYSINRAGLGVAYIQFHFSIKVSADDYIQLLSNKSAYKKYWKSLKDFNTRDMKAVMKDEPILNLYNRQNEVDRKLYYQLLFGILKKCFQFIKKDSTENLRNLLTKYLKSIKKIKDVELQNSEHLLGIGFLILKRFGNKNDAMAAMAALTFNSSPKNEQGTETFRYKFIMRLNKFLESCSICYNSLIDNTDAVSLLQCNHIFHNKCISEWLEKENTCPLCRAEVQSNTHIDCI
eukprot:NODE_187_length_15673_cov_0.222743.p3 type:complete len:398 gc:universal NODE_187_length_15673_cov_0.222743:211-1404(+)